MTKQEFRICVRKLFESTQDATRPETREVDTLFTSLSANGTVRTRQPQAQRRTLVYKAHTRAEDRAKDGDAPGLRRQRALHSISTHVAQDVCGSLSRLPPLSLKPFGCSLSRLLAHRPLLSHDAGGNLDPRNLKKPLKKMMDAHTKRIKQRAVGEATAAALRERVERHRDGILVAAQASEGACAALVAARHDSSIGSKLGDAINSKGMKAGDVASQWDSSGDGEIDKTEFRKHVLALGVVARPADIDAFFEDLDADGGGSLDMRELQKALRKFTSDAEARRDHIRVVGLETISAFKAFRRSQAEYEAELKAERSEADKPTAAPGAAVLSSAPSGAAVLSSAPGAAVLSSAPGAAVLSSPPGATRPSSTSGGKSAWALLRKASLTTTDASLVAASRLDVASQQRGPERQGRVASAPVSAPGPAPAPAVARRQRAAAAGPTQAPSVTR